MHDQCPPPEYLQGLIKQFSETREFQKLDLTEAKFNFQDFLIHRCYYLENENRELRRPKVMAPLEPDFDYPTG